MDLKYVTSEQIIEVTYEQHLRRFAVTSVPPQTASLETKFDALSVGKMREVWTVSWDTAVYLVADHADADVSLVLSRSRIPFSCNLA